MFIKVEPADFFMYTVKLIFDVESPDSEDEDVRNYLEERELTPPSLSKGARDGRACQIMQFGGCYLGRHLDQLGQIQRKAVEVEVLVEEIQRHLADESGCLELAYEESLMAALVDQFHEDSAFQTGENGELVAVLDGNAVKEAAGKHVVSEDCLLYTSPSPRD